VPLPKGAGLTAIRAHEGGSLRVFDGVDLVRALGEIVDMDGPGADHASITWYVVETLSERRTTALTPFGLSGGRKLAFSILAPGSIVECSISLPSTLHPSLTMMLVSEIPTSRITSTV
jgi:hypothetical protein